MTCTSGRQNTDNVDTTDSDAHILNREDVLKVQCGGLGVKLDQQSLNRQEKRIHNQVLSHIHACDNSHVTGCERAAEIWVSVSATERICLLQLPWGMLVSAEPTICSGKIIFEMKSERKKARQQVPEPNLFQRLHFTFLINPVKYSWICTKKSACSWQFVHPQ